MNDYNGKIHIVYDGMWGSCGKGKFCGTFARDKSLDISICVNNNAPNSGHTFVFDDGRKVVTRHLPIGMVNPDIPYLVIGESAVIDIDVLKKELSEYKDLLNGRKVYICDTAAIISEKHKQAEKEQIKTGSTLKGSGAALVGKIMRQEKNIARYSSELKELADQGLIELVDGKVFFSCIYNGLAGFNANENILVECSQGDALSMNSPNYPYTTSRDCGPSQAIKDIHAADYAKNITKYCVFRPYPIRINNQSETGYNYTGDFEGAKEIDWAEIARRSRMPEEMLKQIEQTTVTKRLRRVAEFSVKQFQEMLLDTKPDVLILNFAEQINSSVMGITNNQTKMIQTYFENGGAPLNLDNLGSGEDTPLSDEEFAEVCEKNFALEQIAYYIDDFCELYNELLQNKANINIKYIGTGARECETIMTDMIKYNSMGRNPDKVCNPLDYADKSNHINLNSKSAYSVDSSKYFNDNTLNTQSNDEKSSSNSEDELGPSNS